MDDFDNLFRGNATFIRSQIDHILKLDSEQARESLVLLIELAHSYGKCDGLKLARDLTHGQ